MTLNNLRQAGANLVEDVIVFAIDPVAGIVLHGELKLLRLKPNIINIDEIAKLMAGQEFLAIFSKEKVRKSGSSLISDNLFESVNVSLKNNLAAVFVGKDGKVKNHPVWCLTSFGNAAPADVNYDSLQLFQLLQAGARMLTYVFMAKQLELKLPKIIRPTSPTVMNIKLPTQLPKLEDTNWEAKWQHLYLIERGAKTSYIGKIPEVAWDVTAKSKWYPLPSERMMGAYILNDGENEVHSSDESGTILYNCEIVGQGEMTIEYFHPAVLIGADGVESPLKLWLEYDFPAELTRTDLEVAKALVAALSAVAIDQLLFYSQHPNLHLP
jgi:hypothetical protein